MVRKRFVKVTILQKFSTRDLIPQIVSLSGVRATKKVSSRKTP